MKFWDASAIVPLLVEEQVTPAILDLYRADPLIIAWWGSPVECASAIARLERSGALDLAAALAAAEQNPGPLEMVCLDTRLAAAAQREGLRVATRSG